MPTVTEPVFDIRTGKQTGTITVTVQTQAEADAFTAAVAAEAANDLTLRQQADAALANLRTERDRSYSGLTTAASIAALVSAVKLLCRVQIGVIRLLIRRVEGVD